jgi:SAM-dependent methyltransferase
MEATYGAWAQAYDEFEGEASADTWRRGIVAELGRLGCRADHRVLDLGAGTGMGMRLLGRAFPGVRVDSLDRSASMLARGGIPPESSIVADMADFQVTPGAYDFVVSGFDALNCLDPYRLARCLACAAAALRPGGWLVFDYSSRRMLKYDWADQRVERRGAAGRLQVRLAYEPVLDRTRVELALRGEDEAGRGEQWHETHHHYTVDPFLMEELARAAGLEVPCVRNLDGEGFSPASTTHLYVMRRGGDEVGGAA